MTLWPASETPVRCAAAGHPGVTYDPKNRITWCLCGERTYLGRSKAVDQHIACCGGQLDRFKRADCTNPPENQEEGD